MSVKFANNAHSTLASSVSTSATSITVASGQGARFPSLSSGEYFYATLIDTSNNLEIVKVTGRSTDVLTATRAQEGTTARAFASGDRIELRVTAQGLVDATTIQADQVVNSMIATDAVNSDSIAANAVTASELNISGNGTAGQAVLSDGDGSFSYGTSSPLLQRKYFYFNEGLTGGSAGGWHNMGHPLGDGTLNMTPTATNNIIEIQFRFFIGHQDTWQASTQRVVVSTDGGSSYGTANGLGSTGGYGGVLNYLSGSSRVGDTHAGTVWYAVANTNNHKFKWQYYGASGGQGFYVNSYESNNAGGTAYSTIIISEYDVSASQVTNGGAL